MILRKNKGAWNHAVHHHDSWISSWILHSWKEGKAWRQRNIWEASLAECAVVIDRLQQLEMLINNNPELLTDKDIMAIRKGYTQDYFRLCNELGLSPQSCAKLGSLSLQKDQQNNDVLLKILEGGAGWIRSGYENMTSSVWKSLVCSMRIALKVKLSLLCRICILKISLNYGTTYKES